jgi:hypothetical protein
MDSTQQLLGLLLGSVVLVSLVAIIGGFVHCRRERLLRHAERMKALELGRELPDDVATARIKAAFGNPSSGSDEDGSEPAAHATELLPRKMFTTALWIAFWGFLFAAQGGSASHAVAIAIAVSTGAIGVSAMICGTILALRAPAPVTASATSKPKIEDDAFDVVSRRG